MKTTISLFFIVMTMLSIIIMGMSIGWMLTLFCFFFIPVIVVHIIAGAKALKRQPALQKEIIISSIAFLVLSLLRFDMDDADAYTGYSVLLFKLGLRESQYATPWGSFYYVSMALYILLLLYDLKLKRKAKAPPAVPTPGEFV